MIEHYIQQAHVQRKHHMAEAARKLFLLPKPVDLSAHTLPLPAKVRFCGLVSPQVQALAAGNLLQGTGDIANNPNTCLTRQTDRVSSAPSWHRRVYSPGPVPV